MFFNLSETEIRNRNPNSSVSTSLVYKLLKAKKKGRVTVAVLRQGGQMTVKTHGKEGRLSSRHGRQKTFCTKHKTQKIEHRKQRSWFRFCGCYHEEKQTFHKVHRIRILVCRNSIIIIRLCCVCYHGKRKSSTLDHMVSHILNADPRESGY